ncbi:unnamed protein product [Angiostrongylus costaricensis]|uniref:Protein kinase domain-containing protein n=1 Tax=Angiostrongylus costaricensis TaxID=334426 RepID=A0A158PD38_ANGCS|nr:unnamed protein product [Angiostrongylus costaricensis]
MILTFGEKPSFHLQRLILNIIYHEVPFSLGSTRFMKVARGRNSEGACVWKVFLTQEDAIVYEPYRKGVFRIRDALVNAPNCCVMKRIYVSVLDISSPKSRSIKINTKIAQVTPKWAVLIRPFQKQTLCDRLSTRPYIIQQEKIWYIYQIFKALAQCQKANVCHGDLKSQNVLISSWNWLQITDFAPYKPSYLPHVSPEMMFAQSVGSYFCSDVRLISEGVLTKLTRDLEDNPSSFTFFFDTSRHQHCYLAPERFLSSVDYEINHKEKGDEWLFGSLEHSMDLFAAGCVVYELLHESGKPPFSYGELCNYKLMSDSEAAAFVERLLLSIAPQYRPLLKMLLSRDPSVRLTAQQVVSSFISRLKRDEKSIWQRLTECEENHPYAVLFISLITANIRVLRGVPAKIDAMNMLVKLSSLCVPVVATERILPYLVIDAQVRAAAVYSITELLRPIEPTTFEDSLIFIDYLLPELRSTAHFQSSMLSDKRHPCPTHVLLAVATNLGDLAETAYR